MSARLPHIPEAHATSPIVRKLYRIMKDRDVQLEDVSRLSGISVTSLRYWAYGRNAPSLMNFEAVAQALGYRLALEREERNE